MSLLTAAAAVFGAVAAFAGAVAGLIYLVGVARKAFRTVDSLDKILHRELNHNHGSSIKDDVHGIAVTLGAMSRMLDNLDERVGSLESTITRET